MDVTGSAIPKNTECTVLLLANQILFESEGRQLLVVPLAHMKSIQVHQPIFGANYISGEYTDRGANTTFTMTFSRGGATEFARTFFSLTEGRLVSDDSSAAVQHTTGPGHQPTQEEDKKNK